MAHDVFISYSSKDKETAQAVCTSLESTGISCWIAPRNITAGCDWGEEIVKGISQTKIMVLIFSSSSNGSQQVLREVERAISKNVIIIPFRIEDTLPTKAMEYYLYATHWLDALTPDLDKHIDTLLYTIKKILSEPESYESHVPVKKTFSKRKNRPYLALAVAGVFILAACASGIWYGNLQNTQGASQPSTSTVSQGTGTSSGNSGALAVLSGTAGSTAQNSTQSPAGQAVTPTGVNTVSGTGSNTATADNSANGASVNGSAGGNSNTDASSANAKAEVSKKQLKAGDYITLGSYMGTPIVWRVINISDNGAPLLLSDKILCIKPFDAAESGIYYQTESGLKYSTGKTYTTDEQRKMRGSNCWFNSNLREWLNSSSKAVSYSTMPPKSEGVMRNYNGYASEPGFLSSFSQADLALIKPVTHKVVLSAADEARKDSGTELYAHSRYLNITQVIGNYLTAFSQNVQDRVFLLSVAELNDYVFNRGWEIEATVTQQAANRDEYADGNSSRVKSGVNTWWLISPDPASADQILTVSCYNRDIWPHEAVRSDIGVRPALYLVSGSLPLNGTGTSDVPYTLANP